MGLTCGRMLLLHRQQPPDMPDNNSAVVNLKDVPTTTAGESVEKS